MSLQRFVFVLDDGPADRAAGCDQLRRLGYAVAPAESASQLPPANEPGEACILAPVTADLDGAPWPWIALARGATTAEIVAAMRRGAVTVLDAPPDDAALAAAVDVALALAPHRRQQQLELLDVRQRLASLSEKEQAVLEMIVAGRPNKAMANQLGSSLRTIENRRRDVFVKMGVRSVAELVTLVRRAEAGQAPSQA